MNLYLWDTSIGQFIAYAESAEAARRQVLNQMRTSDAAYLDLVQATNGEPTKVDEPFAALCWHQ
mgnify:CR=1 FL=1